ncbi:MAG: HEAT repeat domain-containing protein [Elusimicrobia bacterium]|nr:HEAT repeat domain-containing protein [Elusimicrobiota bacterium]
MKRFILLFVIIFFSSLLIGTQEYDISLAATENGHVPALDLLTKPSGETDAGGIIADKELGKKALTLIVKEMKNSDSDIRMLSCEILGKIGNKAAAKVLKNSLRDISKHVQISAAEALYKLGDKDALKVILAIINDVPGKKPIANTPLLQMKVISKNKIRERAIEAVVRVLDDDSKDLLYNLKTDVYGTIRDVASRQLAMLGEDEEIPHFIYALENEDEAIRYEAALSLSKICSSVSISPLKSALEKETSMRVKIAILDFFLCVGGRKIFMEDMIGLSSSPNATIRFKSTLALANIKDKKVLGKMKEIYSSGKDLGIKLAAMKGLIKHGQTSETGVLNAALASNDTEIKLLALDIINDFSIANAIPLLRIALEDKDAKVRLEAARQIVKKLSKKRKKK